MASWFFKDHNSNYIIDGWSVKLIDTLATRDRIKRYRAIWITTYLDRWWNTNTYNTKTIIIFNDCMYGKHSLISGIEGNLISGQIYILQSSQPKSYKNSSKRGGFSGHCWPFRWCSLIGYVTVVCMWTLRHLFMTIWNWHVSQSHSVNPNLK